MNDQVVLDIEKAFPQIVAVLNVLVASNVLHSSSGIVITQLLNDVEGVVSGAQNPTVDLVAKVEQLLSDVTNDGILKGQIIESAAAGLSQVKAFVADVQSNQVAIIKVASLFGVSGCYAFIPNESDQGVSLGLGAKPA